MQIKSKLNAQNLDDLILKTNEYNNTIIIDLIIRWIRLNLY